MQRQAIIRALVKRLAVDRRMYEYNDSRANLSTELKSSKLLKIINKASVCEDRDEAKKLIKKADKVSRKLSAFSDF